MIRNEDQKFVKREWWNLPERKYSLSTGVWRRLCNIQLIKQVLPKLVKPLRPIVLPEVILLLFELKYYHFEGNKT